MAKIEDYAFSKTQIEYFDCAEGNPPEAISQIGNYAFYNCRELKSFSFGPDLVEIGSDAFMNCIRLRTLFYEGSPKMTGALQKILTQVTGEVEVVFGNRDFPNCRLIFPEYAETYDEIGPAHVFGRHIEGEGFRARQCFANGGIDFKAYDTIWEKARAEERESTLCLLAADRLLYPEDLDAEAKEKYSLYLKEHRMFFAGYCVKNRDAELMELLSELEDQAGPLFEQDLYAKAAELAAEAGWPEGVAEFLSLQY